MERKKILLKIKRTLRTGVLSIFPSSRVGTIRERLVALLELNKSGRFNSAYSHDIKLPNSAKTLTLRVSDHAANPIHFKSDYNVSIIVTNKEIKVLNITSDNYSEVIYRKQWFNEENKEKTLTEILMGIEEALTNGRFRKGDNGEQSVTLGDISGFVPRITMESWDNGEYQAIRHRLPQWLLESEPSQDEINFYNFEPEAKSLVDEYNEAVTAFLMSEEADDAEEQEETEDTDWGDEEEDTATEPEPEPEPEPAPEPKKPKATKPKQPKAAKPKAPKQPKADRYDERVNKPLAQVALARRFVLLHDKFFTPETHAKAVSILTALQRAIVNREIRKEGHGDKSAYCTEMRAMQEALLRIVKQKPMSGKRLTIDNVEAFRAVAKAQGSLASADAIRKFVSISGKKPEQKRAQSALDKVAKVIDSGEAGNHADVLEEIRESLKHFIAGSSDFVQPIGQSLEGIGIDLEKKK